MKPKHVCVSCVSKLESCVSFMDMLLEADSKFEELLQNKETADGSVNGSTFSPSDGSLVRNFPQKEFFDHVNSRFILCRNILQHESLTAIL